MAEQELIKHAKNAYKVWTSKEHTFWNKLKDFIVEILIIVFAVTLSIRLHEYSVHKEQAKEAKFFLIGLKSDIRDDIDEVKGILDFYKKADSCYSYLSNLKKDSKIEALKFQKAIDLTGYSSFLRPNTSRFDSFKSSGKLNQIENDSILLEILYLYQEAIPQLKTSEGAWLKSHTKLQDYLFDNLVQKDNGDPNYYELIVSPKGKRICQVLIPFPQLLERNNQIIKVGEKIINMINVEYNLK